MTVITYNYRTHNTNLLIEDFSINDYYIFASSIDTSETTNTDYSENDFLEKTIFGKKVNPADVKFLIENNRWTLNTVFDQYDDRVDLSNKNFYAIVYPSDNTTGDYRVYKCLFNNYGSPSTNPPNYDENTDDQIYRMGDGYIWKYMYAISVQDFEKYSALTFAPIIADYSVSNTSIEKTIDIIEVTNYETNKGYETRVGVIEEVLTNDIIIYTPALNFSEVTNYYTGQSFYVTSPDNISRVYTIDSYSYNTITLRATIRLLDKDAFIQENYTFQILPRVEISGDGTGAIAIPKINELGTITQILVLNKGSGYTNAIARVVRPLFGFDPVATNSVDVEAILRPILSPKGGHGSNLMSELRSKRAMVYTSITDSDNLVIPTTNTYTKIGLVKNPAFTTSGVEVFDNRLHLELETNTLAVGEIITQTSQGVVTFSAEVHDMELDTVHLCNYHGPYQNYLLDGYSDLPIDESRPIVSSQNQILNINNIMRPVYLQKTGNVYYMSSFSAITRTPSSNEEYKIILEF